MRLPSQLVVMVIGRVIIWKSLMKSPQLPPSLPEGSRLHIILKWIKEEESGTFGWYSRCHLFLLSLSTGNDITREGGEDTFTCLGWRRRDGLEQHWMVPYRYWLDQENIPALQHTYTHTIYICPFSLFSRIKKLLWLGLTVVCVLVAAVPPLQNYKSFHFFGFGASTVFTTSFRSFSECAHGPAI